MALDNRFYIKFMQLEIGLLDHKMVKEKQRGGGGTVCSPAYMVPKDPSLSRVNPIPHGGGADSALLQIVFFITSVRDAAEPRNMVTFLQI